MAWKSQRQDIALEWSVTSLLEASIDVILSFLVLICALINFGTASFIRVSGLHIPCPCCNHHRERKVTSTGRSSEGGLMLQKSSLSSLSAVAWRQKISCNADRCQSSLQTATSKIYADSISVADPAENTPSESLHKLQVNSSGIGNGAAAEDVCHPQLIQEAEDCREREQEALTREQDRKDKELMETLQSERESLTALYSELEEERNSSATAASEALAMISRLQEEKAAVQMEARQFQRMVMEKAMYDQEAIEVLKEILEKCEEEKITLEEEIRVCKERLHTMLMEERDLVGGVGSHILTADKITAEPLSQNPEPANPPECELDEARPVDEEIEKDRAERVESCILTLHGTCAEELSQNFDHADTFKSERIGAVENLDKEELEKDQHARVGNQIPLLQGAAAEPVEIKRTERIGSDARDVKEDPKFLNRLDKTKSQLLTALFQGGAPNSAATYVEESAVFVDDIHNAKAKVPLKSAAVVVLDDENEKSSLGLGSCRTGREINLQIPPIHASNQTGTSAVKNEAEETDFISLKRRWGSRGSQEVSQEALDKAKKDRRLEEKRLSVLEYVWKFEEQLQQQGGKPPIQVVKPKSVGDGTSYKTSGPLERSSSSITPQEARVPLAELDRDDSLRRRLFVGGDHPEINIKTLSFVNGEDDSRCCKVKITNDETGVEKASRVNTENSEQCVGEALFVHDVYEVQNPRFEAPGLSWGV